MKRKREREQEEDHHELIKRFKVFMESRKRKREEEEDDSCAKRARLSYYNTNYHQDRRDMLVYL